MKRKKPPKAKKPHPVPSPRPSGVAQLKPSGIVVVEQHSTPPPGPADKQIHARIPLPLVPNAPASTREDDKEN